MARTIVDYVANTVDFSAQINDILGVEADVIYYSGFCAEGATLMPALRAAGFTQQIVGADAADDSQCPDGGGEAFNGFPAHRLRRSRSLEGDAATRATDFETEFLIENPGATDFNGFTLAGADSLNVTLEAIAQAGDGSDIEAVRDALASLESYPGVTGEITYAGTDGTPADSHYRVSSSMTFLPDNEQGWASNAITGISSGEEGDAAQFAKLWKYDSE